MSTKVLFFLLAVTLFFTSCVRTVKREVIVSKDGITCTAPPPDVFLTSTNIDASLPKVIDILKKESKAKGSMQQTYQVIRSEVHNFEVLESRLCLALQNHAITKEQYAFFVTSILPQANLRATKIQFEAKQFTGGSNIWADNTIQSCQSGLVYNAPPFPPRAN